jgi:aminopeptidase
VLEPQISERDLETWADYLVEHSLGGVHPFERVMIKGERIGWPLMAVLERKVIAGGGIPDVCLVPPNNDRGRIWSAAIGLHGTPEQIAAIPGWHKARYESFDKYVEVLGAEDPSLYGGLTPSQAGAIISADAPFSGIRLAKNWVITLYPTPGMAAMEGIPLDEYVDFIVRASTTDPRPLKAAEERIAPLIAAGRQVELVTRCPDRNRDLRLTLGITPCLPRMSYGLRNFPDGEVFTSPDANTPEGEVYVDLPVHYGGHDIQGIYLRLAGGRIVEYSALVGGAHLGSIIETDEGSHRLGEVAVGMNPGLDRVLKHPLFVEKVGGTAHIAIGRSYPECYVEDANGDVGKAQIEKLKAEGVINDSAQHVDIVIDFRPGGAGRRLSIDDRELLVLDRVWVPAD